MKAQRRHELQTNDLAGWLAQTIEHVAPHATKILLGVVLAVLLVAAAIFLANRTGGKSADQWEQFYAANSQETADSRITELTGVADQFPGSLPGLWARLSAADARLARGTEQSYKDRLAGEADLQQAQKDYEAVAKGAASFPKPKSELLTMRAMWGLAETLEAQAQGDAAAQQYKKLADAYPDSALGKAAAERAKYIGAMGDWFKWYASVDPTQVKPTRMQDPTMNPGGSTPSFNDLDLPDITLPKPLEGSSGAGATPGGSFEESLGLGSELPPLKPDTSAPAGEAVDPAVEKPTPPAETPSETPSETGDAPGDAPRAADSSSIPDVTPPPDPAVKEPAPAPADAPAEPGDPAGN